MATPIAALPDVYAAGSSIRLLGKQAKNGKKEVQPFFNDSTLVTKGVAVGRIINVSTFHARELDNKYPLNSSYASVTELYKGLHAIREALWRTLVGNTTRDGGSAPSNYSWLLEPTVWDVGVAGVFTNEFGLHEFMRRNKNLLLCGYRLVDIVFDKHNYSRVWKTAGRVYNPTEEQREALSWAMNTLAWRRLVGTSSGHIGLVPAAASEMDTIAVLWGCDVPMVLRSSNGGWKVIGEAYLHGVMNGEVAEAVEGGRMIESTFWLR